MYSFSSSSFMSSGTSPGSHLCFWRGAYVSLSSAMTTNSHRSVMTWSWLGLSVISPFFALRMPMGTASGSMS